ncbi:MAG: ribokinase [Clostridia bacterium]|nr:ribokinase [Clostridia bacterium]MBQ9803200.1 ribokinase [Clostridia bacterium]
MGNVLVVGSINVDYVIHTDRLPRLGETLVGRDFAMNFGGKGANQAVALAKSGCRVKMLGAVGNDTAGELAIKNLEDCGVDTAAVLRVARPTGAAVITVCDGDNHIILDAGANDCITPETVLKNEALFDWADVLVMQYEIPTPSVLCAAGLAKSKKKTVILNPAPAKEVDAALYALVDWLIPNEFEVQLITGIEPSSKSETARAMAALRQMGCKNAVVTLGKRGCAYHLADEVAYAGVFPVQSVDTTSAGDSFIGGFCTALCDKKDAAEAVLYASAVAAITVSRAGACVSIPTAAEVREFLRTNRIEQI